MTTIYLVRHAEAEGNLYRRIHGWYDALVTENGFAQMKCLEERFRDIPVDEVWSSDLYRTMTTARAVYVPKNLPLHTDPRLRELNFGDWEDRPWGEVYQSARGGDPPLQRQRPHLAGTRGREPDRGRGAASPGGWRPSPGNPGRTVAIFSHGTAHPSVFGPCPGPRPGTVEGPGAQREYGGVLPGV